MLSKRYILALLVLVCTAMQAQYYNSITSLPQSYLTLSFGAGANINMTDKNNAASKLGGTGMFAFSYEVSKKSFFFNIGVGLDYMYTQMGLDPFAEEFARHDRDGREIKYRYCYDSYLEHQHTLLATLPIQFGYRCSEHFYVALGAKVAYPFFSQYKTVADMYTEGEYVQLMQPISKNVPSYGYYPSATYEGKGNRPMNMLTVSPTFEIGAWIPVRRKISCRLGAFCEYAIPLMQPDIQTGLVDYSQVDVNPFTQNQDNLHENWRAFSSTHAAYGASIQNHNAEDMICNHVAQYLTVGVRCTIRFNVTAPPHRCNCDKDTKSKPKRK